MKESLCSGCSGGMRCVLVCLAVMATAFHKSEAMCVDGELKVMGTNTANLKAGYIEMCIGGVVRAVCAFDWNDDDAIVTCRQLGFTGGYQAFGCGGSCLGRSNETTGIRGFQCSNQEIRLIDCNRSTDRRATCTQNAGVVCINSNAVPECPTTQSPASTCPENPTQQPKGAQQSCLALGGGMGALTVILTIILVGVVIWWVWSCHRRTGNKKRSLRTFQNPTYTTTSPSSHATSTQYSAQGPRDMPLNPSPMGATPSSTYDVIRAHPQGGGERIYQVLEAPGKGKEEGEGDYEEPGEGEEEEGGLTYEVSISTKAPAQPAAQQESLDTEYSTLQHKCGLT